MPDHPILQLKQRLRLIKRLIKIILYILRFYSFKCLLKTDNCKLVFFSFLRFMLFLLYTVFSAFLPKSYFVLNTIYFFPIHYFFFYFFLFLFLIRHSILYTKYWIFPYYNYRLLSFSFIARNYTLYAIRFSTFLPEPFLDYILNTGYYILFFNINRQKGLPVLREEGGGILLSPEFWFSLSLFFFFTIYYFLIQYFLYFFFM